MIDAGSFMTCGINTGGTALCWGHNRFAQLGRRTTETCAEGGQSNDPCGKTPGPVSGELIFRTVDAGGYRSCGIGTDGRAYCWGSDTFSALGTTETDERCTANNIPCTYTPRPVGDRSDFQQIETSGVFTCARTQAGQVFCWGSNYYGQLGDSVSNPFGTGEGSREPLLLSGGHKFSKISLGGDHGCGLTDGRIFCWGYNNRGQLGRNSRLNSNTPVEVLNPTG